MPDNNTDPIALLLEVADQLNPALSAHSATMLSAATQALAELGYLVKVGDDRVVVTGDDHATLRPSANHHEDADGLWAWHDQDGLVQVGPTQLQRWEVSWSGVLRAVSAELALPKTAVPLVLQEGQLWDLGLARIGRRAHRHAVWFARCLWRTEQWKQFQNFAIRRPTERQRIVLSTTPADRLPTDVPAGNLLLSLHDVLALPTDLTVAVGIVDRRLGGTSSRDVPTPLHLSEDGVTLTINGMTTLTFRSGAQRAAIRKLVDGYRKGKPLRASEIVERQDLGQFFGGAKWITLRQFLEQRDGGWIFSV